MPLSDIFREVEEDVRKRTLEKIWKAYGDYVIALLVLLFCRRRRLRVVAAL